MEPMFINLHSHVLARLAARELPWTQVARETGIPYETLKKIASGRTPNPGVQHVQKLADYFGAGLSGATAADRAVVKNKSSDDQARPTIAAPQDRAQPMGAAVQPVPWDGITERRKLNAPVDRRVSPASVARAEFLRTQVVSPPQQGV